MPYANVFPEPVTALPITSCPCKIFGIAADCMGVGEGKPRLEIAERIICEIGSDDHSDTSVPATSATVSRTLNDILDSSSFCAAPPFPQVLDGFTFLA